MAKFPYDLQLMHQLEGDARAAAHLLARRVGPVIERIARELEEFTLETASAEDCRRRNEMQDLLSALRPYSETMDAYVEQLKANLQSTEEALHQEAVRGSFAMRECQLLNQDNQQLRDQSIRELASFESVLNRLRAQPNE